MKKIAISFIILFCHIYLLNAQNDKFGKINKSVFENTFYKKDSSACAVVLYKDRNTHYKYNNLTGWSLSTTVYERIQIFSAEGFKYATQKIRLYEGNENETFLIKAYTYNLDNGKITKTKLEKQDIYEDKLNDNWKAKNFTMPNVKEGSVIEWRYSISSPYVYAIDDMVCQYDIPIVYLESSIQIPEYFVFNSYPSIYYPIKLKRDRVQKNYANSSTSRDMSTHVSTTTTDYNSVKIAENRYTVKENDVPALISEPYVNNMDNYRAKVQFEISSYNPPSGASTYYNTTWKDVTRTIYDNPRFGKQLKSSRHFSDDLEAAIAGLNSSNEKISIIFDLVKSKMTWNKTNSKYSRREGIDNAYKEGVGNAAEINLTLVAMLRNAGINANPILVSTRSHGIPLFPTKSGFNYVIAGVEINNEVILMDATEKYGKPNLLPLRDLNWQGRLIRENGSSTSVNLYPKTYNTRIVKLNAKLNPQGSLEGTMISTYHGLNALNHRNLYQAKSEDDVAVSLETEHQDIEIQQIRLQNKEKASKPFTEMFKFNKDNEADLIGGKIYISPLLFLTVNESPFKLDERLYPIDFGSPWKNDTKISLEIPEGYLVESKPADLALSLPDQMGSYILKTEIKNNKILISSQTKLNVPLISPNYYETVKELYKRVIETQLEKIILVQQGP